MLGKTGFAERLGIEEVTLSVFIRVRVVDQVRLRIIDTNTHITVAKDLADLVADRIVDALNVQFRGKRSLNAVDDRQLGVALLGFLQ